ncbi:unnamed protein product [Rotaria socialis]
MYAFSLLQPIKRQKIVSHHSNELKLLQNLLQNEYPLITTVETSRLENGLRLSICLPKEENLLKKSDYEYLYVVEASSTLSNKLESDIKKLLKINEFYSIENNVIKILDKKLLIEKQKKIDPNKLIKELSDNDIEMILNQLSVERNQLNKETLCRNLGLTFNQLYQTDQIFHINDYELVKKLHKKLTKVLHSDWSLNSIEQIINRINTKQDLENLFNALDPIYEYNLKEFHKNIEGKCLIDILTTISFSSKYLTRDIHDIALYQTFQGTYDKNAQQLKDDILNLNRNQNISILQNNKLIEEYEKIQTAYENKSKLCPEFCVIQKWSESNIKEWSKKVKTSSMDTVNLYEKIAVVKKAVELTSKFPPREIQLLSILILMNPEENKGRLAQINTGEGKTTIVAMLATLKALEGHCVDVITSSPELAKPQSIHQENFYNLFNLTVSHNGTDTIDIKERYNANIVYGAASDFQGDILRDEYSKLGTRNGRKCDIAIVDEVDSMLIDGKNHIVMLSSPMPAMDHLEPLLAAIWIQIQQVAKCIQEIDGQDYYIEHSDIFNDDGTVKSDIIEAAFPLETSKEEFIKKATENHIRKLIRDVKHLPDTDKEIPEEYPEIKIPKHLRQLIVESQLIKWIDSAIYARYQCQNNQHYVLRNGKIAPVDASNTGIVQENMHWNDGLHQFLQIKHGAKITAESLTTNFLSNVTYFQKYGSNIYGLTGTLGSEKAQELLSKIYHVDHVIIPPFRKKQYQELTPIILKNENDWHENIIESSMNKLNNGRGVLIITKYIKEVDEIKSRLNKIGYDSSKIKTYRTEDESNSIEEDMKPGEIIIATNIAGRGTDIRANKIEQNGGLHVLITFLPPNERVEQQNIGRTARTGNKGTGQFILLEKDKDNYEQLKAVRNKREEDSIRTAETEIEKVTIKDAIFKEFCNLLTSIAGNHMTTDITTKIKARAVEDRFSIWLKLNEQTITTNTKEEMLKKFNLFQQKILNDKERDTLIENAYFYILIGNEYLNEKDNVKNQDAIDQYTKAIELDEPFQANAYYNRGYARIDLYGKKCKKYIEEIDKAIDDFKQAKRIIEDNFEPMLHIIQQASNSEAISEQIIHKMALFNVQKNTIELAIGTENSTDIEIEELEKQKNLRSEDRTQIQEQINNLKDNKQLRENGIIGQARANKQNIEIEHLEIEKALPEDQDIKLYNTEINEYENNGFRGCFKIKKIKPIDWWSVISVAALGIAQLVSGAALAVFSLGAGASIGMGLMFEGVSDLITAVKDGIINRDFSWATYGIQKAISLTVSLVCAGFGAIKNAAKTVVVGVKSFGQGLTTTTVKTGWKIVAKSIGISLAKGVGEELAKELIGYGVNKTLIPLITEEIMKRVEEPIQNALLTNNCVKTMLELDAKNRNSKYESLIKIKAMELLNSREHQSALKAITTGIIKGIAKRKVSSFSALLTTYEMAATLHELERFVPNFISKLNEQIEKIYKEEKIEEIISQHEYKSQQKQQQYEVNKQSTIDNNNKIKTNIKEENHQNDMSTFTMDRSDNDIGSKNVQEEEQIKLNRENTSPDGLCRILATNVSAHMCNIIQHKLIAPITHVGIHFGMTKITAELDRNLQEQIGHYQSEKRIEVSQDIDQHYRLSRSYKRGSENPEALAKAGKMVEDIKNDGEAGLPHLGSLSDAVGRPIKVYNKKGELMRIIGKKKGGVPVEIQYHKPNKDNPSGHWTLPGGKEPVVNNSGKNNCLFNVIAEQTKIDSNQLRADTAIRMENSKAILANQAFDIMRLEQYKQSALTMGGVKLQGQTIYFDDEEIDQLIKLAESGFNKREEAPRDLDIIRAQDDKGKQVVISKHHVIPECQVREDFKDLVKQYRNDRNGLKRELIKYINHENNAIAKERFINVFKLKDSSKVTNRPELVVAEIQNSVSWHANNFRIGPEGALRNDDPTKRETPFGIDFPVADKDTKVCLNQYIKRKTDGQVDILCTLNKLPNNVNNFAWKLGRHGKYEVDPTNKIGKTSHFYKSKRPEDSTFNPFRSK